MEGGFTIMSQNPKKRANQLICLIKSHSPSIHRRSHVDGILIRLMSGFLRLSRKIANWMNFRGEEKRSDPSARQHISSHCSTTRETINKVDYSLNWDYAIFTCLFHCKKHFLRRSTIYLYSYEQTSNLLGKLHKY